MITLILTGTSVSFGAAGTPLLSAVNGPYHLCGEDWRCPFYHAPYGTGGLPPCCRRLFVPLIGLCCLVVLFGEDKSLKHAFAAMPFAFFAGLVYVVPYYCTARFLGPEFPALLGGLVGLPLLLWAAKSGFLAPKTRWDFPAQNAWPADWRSQIELEETNGQRWGCLYGRPGPLIC